MKPFLKPLYNVYIFLSKNLKAVMVPLPPTYHQPPHQTVTWKPERINSASWEFFLRGEHQVQPRNHEINVGFGFRLFLLISPKKCWDVGFYVDPDFFIELISPTKDFLYGFFYQIMYKSFQ